MTLGIYTQLTMHSRFIESLVAMFGLFWAASASALIGNGGAPFFWAEVYGANQYAIPLALGISGLIHVTGLRLLRVVPLSAILRAIGMGGMACVFGWLCFRGLLSTAGPTYMAFCIACLSGVVNAIRDASYARRLPNE